jgi:hypothetical protein
MKYTIQRLDGRHTYKNLFQYYIGFSNRMSNNQGPLNFTLAQKWFTETYGWSAEVRQYAEILEWSDIKNAMNGLMRRKFSGHPLLKNPGSGYASDIPEVCNSKWSWTNGYDDLRIYVASDKELSWFQISNKMVG